MSDLRIANYQAVQGMGSSPTVSASQTVQSEASETAVAQSVPVDSVELSPQAQQIVSMVVTPDVKIDKHGNMTIKFKNDAPANGQLNVDKEGNVTYMPFGQIGASTVPDGIDKGKTVTNYTTDAGFTPDGQMAARSVSINLGKVTGKLNIHGSNKDDNLLVELDGDKKNVNIYGHKGDDNIRVMERPDYRILQAQGPGFPPIPYNPPTLNNSNIKIHGGEGNDNLQVDTGNGNSNNISIKGGQGDDAIGGLIGGNKNKLKMYGNKGNDKIFTFLEYGSNENEVSAYGGEGTDGLEWHDYGKNNKLVKTGMEYEYGKYFPHPNDQTDGSV